MRGRRRKASASGQALRFSFSESAYRVLLFAAGSKRERSKRERELFDRHAMDDYRELCAEARAEGKMGLARLWAGVLLPDLARVAVVDRITGGGGVRRPSGFENLLRLLCFIFVVDGAAVAATGLLSLALALLHAFDRLSRLGVSPEVFQSSTLTLNFLVGVLCVVAGRKMWRAMRRVRSELHAARSC